MQTKRSIASGLALLSGLVSPTFAQQPAPILEAAPTHVAALHKLATEVFGVTPGPILRSGIQGNTAGIVTKDLLVSHRTDSRTYFVVDGQFGPGKSKGVFEGTEEEHLEAAQAVLRGLNIPLDEVGQTKLLTEMTQVGHMDPISKRPKTEPAQPGRRVFRLSRTVTGIPVFSSHALMGLTADKSVGFLEAHWPEIPLSVLDEARRLHTLVQNGWKPPEQSGAKVISVQAGIIHSPAVAMVMDIYPAIQVVYESADPTISQKGLVYLDANSKAVPVPREFAVPPVQSTVPELLRTPAAGRK
jgi:hypothetical protein